MIQTEEFKEILKGKKAALIDMDGVLYDSMPWHSMAWRETMLELGIDIPEEEFFLYEGMTGPATINLLLEREWGKTLTLEECNEFYSRKAVRFREMGEAPLMAGAREMIENLQKRRIQRVLVTGSAQSSLLDRLEHDYPGGFPANKRVTALDVTNGKPHPEPYLKGLEKAGVRAEEAFVIENAPLGVKAGKGAGLFTVAVMTGPVPHEEFEKAGADIIFPSMPALAYALSVTPTS